MRLTEDGLAEGVRYLPSPNNDARPPAARVELIVVHNISLPPGEFGGNGIIDLFLNRLLAGTHPYYAGIVDLRVSTHFLIRRDGELVQFVPCARRAWHAGVSTWRGRERCNDFSVGIELEGTDEIPFEEAQYLKLREVVAALRMHYPIADVQGHSDIAPGRKTDPGPCFDWRKLE